MPELVLLRDCLPLSDWLLLLEVMKQLLWRLSRLVGTGRICCYTALLFASVCCYTDMRCQLQPVTLV